MTSPSGSRTGKRGQYTRRACNVCRHRRSKCDGVHPTCGSCNFYGHECSWGSDKEATRPPTKQFVQALQVKVQTLEAKLSHLRESVEPKSEQVLGLDPAGYLPQGMLPIPSQFRQIGVSSAHLPTAVPQLTGIPKQPIASPWLFYRTQHTTLIGLGIANQPFDTTYQYIFNIDTLVPVHEQPENVRQSLLCDWDRHLPLLDGGQLTRLEHDIILDRCFRYSSSWLMNIIPPLFLHDMLRTLSAKDSLQADYYSPLLHCSLMAFGAALSDDPLISQLSTRERFVTKAKHLLHEEVNRPSLSMMQSLSLLSEYHYGLGDTERGYMYMGMSTTMVRALGLGTRRGHNNETPSGAISNWNFWSMYLQDKLLASEASGDLMLGLAQHLPELPVVDQEVDRHPWLSTFASTLGAEAEQPNRLTEVFAQSCQLMIIAEPVTQPQGTSVFGGTVQVADHVFNIHFKLQNWLHELPVELHILEGSITAPLPHIIMINICYWWIVLRFYQNLLEGDSSLIGVSQSMGDTPSFSCDRASHEILALTQLYDRWHGLRFFHRRMIQVLFTTGRFFLGKRKLVGLQNTTHQRQNLRTDVLGCISTLHTISKTWHCAEKYARQLKAFLLAQDQETPVQGILAVTTDPH